MLSYWRNTQLSDAVSLSYIQLWAVEVPMFIAIETSIFGVTLGRL